MTEIKRNLEIELQCMRNRWMDMTGLFAFFMMVFLFSLPNGKWLEPAIDGEYGLNAVVTVIVHLFFYAPFACLLAMTPVFVTIAIGSGITGMLGEAMDDLMLGKENILKWLVFLSLDVFTIIGMGVCIFMAILGKETAILPFVMVGLYSISMIEIFLSFYTSLTAEGRAKVIETLK